MKILFLTQRLPYPPFKGDKLRAFNIIKFLSEKHDICLVSTTDTLVDFEYKNDLYKWCKEVKLVYTGGKKRLISLPFALLSSTPLTLWYFYSPEIRKKVVEWKPNVDLIYIFCSSMTQYVLDLDKPKILDFVDVDSDKWRQYAVYTKNPIKKLIYWREARLLGRYEKYAWSRVNKCIVVSLTEQKIFREKFELEVDVVPNGVDSEYFIPNRNTTEKDWIVFVGQMDYFANVDGVLYFVEEIWPKILAKFPNIKFYIVGRNPDKQIRALHETQNVVVTGEVEDVREYLRAAKVCVVPIRIARGIQNKVLEAMACGVPVVTTTNAVQGISLQDGEGVFIVRNPKEFVEKVCGLLEDNVLRENVSKKARKIIEEKFSWKKNLQRLEEIMEEVIRYE